MTVPRQNPRRAFHDPREFPFVAALESHFEGVLGELRALDAAAFVDAPDSLTAVADGYDETGWRFASLFGGGAGDPVNRARCPLTVGALAQVPELVNAAFSLFRPGTHLYPHRGELRGVLRCHLALVVPDGDVGLRLGAETRRWQAGRCLVFDDTVEHEAWNHGAGDRVVLLVTFAHRLGGGGDAVS
ncbi:MAG TPA: aspartyl/asparaginyl beta-hydroxylase domain-containing protein [Planctomycetota bacterium]|nr:aspartyl/asparaginyl beta-hydroxylase domain-containing protein [Planctomycetota bacterium]